MAERDDERLRQQELVRVRDRLHKLESSVQALGWVPSFVRALRQDVDRMARQDEIAAAVAEQLVKDRARFLSWPMKILTATVALCAVAGFAVDIATRIGG